VRQLCIMDYNAVCRLPAAVMATILGTQCGSLLELEIEASRVGFAGAEIAALAALTRLTRLSVRSRPSTRGTCSH